MSALGPSSPAIAPLCFICRWRAWSRRWPYPSSYFLCVAAQLCTHGAWSWGHGAWSYGATELWCHGAGAKRLGTRTLVALWHWNCLRGMQAEKHVARCKFKLLLVCCCCSYLLFVVAVVMICDFFLHIDGHLARPLSLLFCSPYGPCGTVAAAGRNYATCRNFTQTGAQSR